MPGSNVTYSIDFAAEIARLVEGTEKGANAVKDMADRVDSASHFAKSALEALGITLSVHYFAGLIEGAIEAQARLADLATVAGTSAATLSKFEEPARTSGTALDTVAAAVAKLSTSLGEARLGDAEKKNLFRALGIDPDDGRDAAEVMVDVTHALVGMTDQNVAAYVSKQLLAKGFAELRPFMKDVVEQGTLVATTTNEQAARAKELKDEYARLKLQMDLNTRQVAEGMLPAFRDILGVFASTKQSGEDLVAVGEAIGGVFKLVVSTAVGVVTAVQSVARGITGLVEAQQLLGQGKFSEAWDALKAAGTDVGDAIAVSVARIDGLWDQTVDHAKQAAKFVGDMPLANDAKGGNHDAEAKAKKLMEDKLFYQARLTAAKGFADQLIGQIKLENELADISYKEGAVGQRGLIELQRANEDRRLAIQIDSYNEQLRLAVQQGDRAKQQELKNGIAQAEAARQTNSVISAARLGAIDVTDKQEAAKRFTDLQKENLTERERLKQALLEKQAVVDAAERSGLYDAAEIAKQRELIELQHQAAMGDIIAQGILARRNFEQLTLREQVNDVLGTLAQITSGAALHNKTMFEINKVAGIANAIVHTAEGATLALAKYPPPLSFVMAAAQVAAGLIQVQTIRSQSFDGGGSVSSPTPTFDANPNTGLPTAPISSPGNGITAPGGAAPAPTVFNVTLVGETVKTEQVRDLMAMMKDQLPYGATLNIEMTPS